jgi:hypothetical protein
MSTCPGCTPASAGGAAECDQIDFTFSHHTDRTETCYRAPQRESLILRRLLWLQRGDLFANQWVTRFDPPHAVFTFSWTSPDGRLRPLLVRAVVFLVPETDDATRVQILPFARVADPRFRPLLPIVIRAASFLGWLEARDDAKHLARVAGLSTELRGMRLDRFDAALVHNRRLLHSIYYGEGEARAQPAAPTA